MNFEEEYSKRFSEHKSIDGIDEAGIWAAVEKDLERSSGDGNGAGWSRLGLIVGLFAVIGLGCFCTQISKDKDEVFSKYLAIAEVSDAKAKALTAQNANAVKTQSAASVHRDDELSTLESENQVDNNFNARKPSSSNNSKETHSKASLKTHLRKEMDETDKASLSQSMLYEKEVIFPGDRDLQSQESGQLNGGAHVDLSTESIALSEDSDNPANSIISKTVEQNGLNTETLVGNRSQQGVLTSEADRELQPKSKSQVTRSPDLESPTRTYQNSQAELGRDASLATPSAMSKMVLLDIQSHRPSQQVIGDPTQLSVSNYKRSSIWLPHELYLLAGANMMSSRYRSSKIDAVSANLAQVTKSQLGYGATSGATWLINKYIRLGLGFEYSKYRDRLHWQRISEGTMVLDDRLIAIELDSSGLLIPVYGSAEYNSIETRRVRHYNSYEKISVPLLIGVEKSWGRSTAGADFGLAYAKFINQVGRTVNIDNTVIDFDSELDSERAPLKRINFTYSFSPFVDYSISDVIGLRLNPSLTYLPLQKSELLEQERGGFLLNARVGVFFNLD